MNDITSGKRTILGAGIINLTRLIVIADQYKDDEMPNPIDIQQDDYYVFDVPIPEPEKMQPGSVNKYSMYGATPLRDKWPSLFAALKGRNHDVAVIYDFWPRFMFIHDENYDWYVVVYSNWISEDEVQQVSRKVVVLYIWRQLGVIVYSTMFNQHCSLRPFLLRKQLVMSQFCPFSSTTAFLWNESRYRQGLQTESRLVDW